jgi:hypothetical protein
MIMKVKIKHFHFSRKIFGDSHYMAAKLVPTTVLQNISWPAKTMIVEYKQENNIMRFQSILFQYTVMCQWLETEFGFVTGFTEHL